MKREYDLSKMKSRPNRFAKRLTRQVTIRMGTDVIDYFKKLAVQTGIPYQKLINLYLADCVESGRTPSLEWSR
ncbi:MAG TPA: antitoxin [Planctomycetota bacterium]|nr:antitoxin [Planctomycetota bacterium]